MRIPRLTISKLIVIMAVIAFDVAVARALSDYYFPGRRSRPNVGLLGLSSVTTGDQAA